MAEIDNEYNQFAPQKSPAGDQKTNFLLTSYPDNVADEMPMSETKSVQAKNGWDVWQQVRQPI